MPTTCADCGQPFADVPDGSEQRPCPACGSTRRNRVVSLQAGSYGISGASATATVVTYPQRLVSVARDLIGSGEFSIAVVVLHMAAEVAVERRLSEAFAGRGIADLEDSIGEFLNGDNLANDRTRKLFVAVTGDEVHKQSCWPDFKESSTRRNKIVHESRTIGQKEAKVSLDAVRKLLLHLGHAV